MDLGGLLDTLGPYGANGVIIAYLLWRDHRRDDRDEKRDARSAEVSEKRAEADKELATAMTLLSERINVRTSA